MTGPRTISLAQQREAVHFATVRQGAIAGGGTVKGLRARSAEEFDLQRLQAALRTLDWLQSHEAEIRAYLAVPSRTAREAAVAMAHEIARREALAAAGGPVR
jgi:hypothetical protein